MKRITHAMALGSGLILSALLMACGSSGGGSNNNNSCSGSTPINYNNGCYAACTDSNNQQGAYIQNAGTVGYCQSITGTSSYGGSCQTCTFNGGMPGVMYVVNGQQQCIQAVQTNGTACTGMYNGNMVSGNYNNQGYWGGYRSPILPLPGYQQQPVLIQTSTPIIYDSGYYGSGNDTYFTRVRHSQSGGGWSSFFGFGGGFGHHGHHGY